MALIKCQECGQDISSEAVKCPNCGYPAKKLSLKKTKEGWKELKNEAINFVKSLEKYYKNFLIINIAIFTITSIPLLGSSIYFAFGLFCPAILLSISNYIIAKENDYHFVQYDKAVMVLSIVGVVPFIGWFCRIGALIISILLFIWYKE
ncbi:membrane hypothetical protein [Candidatus Magnetomoraceae bacterium gMMP-1]